MNSTVKLAIEALFVGISTVIVGFFVSQLYKLFVKKKQSLPVECKNWNKNHIMEISLFLTGITMHVFYELAGMNKWYCKHGVACTN